MIDQSTGPGKRFAPSLSMQQMQDGWNKLSETQRGIVAYLDGPDSEIFSACHVPANALDAQLGSIYRKLGFHTIAPTKENRVAASSIYRACDLSKRPVGSTEAVIIYAFTGEMVDDFSSLFPGQAMSALSAPKTELDPETLLRTIAANIPHLTGVPQYLLQRAAQERLTDEQLLKIYQEKDRDADLSTIQGYFGRAFTALKIPNELSYDERRKIAVTAIAASLQKGSNMSPPAPTTDPVIEGNELALPSDLELRTLIPNLSKLGNLYRKSLIILATKGADYSDALLAADVSCQYSSVSAIRSTICKLLGLTTPAHLNMRTGARYKIRAAIRIFQLSQMPPEPEGLEERVEEPAADAAPVEEPTSAPASAPVETPIEPMTVPEPEPPVAEAIVAPVPEEELAAEPELVERPVQLPAVIPRKELAEIPQPPSSPIITKANLDLWSTPGLDKKLLDSSSPTFRADLERFLQDGFTAVDGDNLISPDSTFEARVIITLTR